MTLQGCESTRTGSLKYLPATSLFVGGKNIMWFHNTVNTPRYAGIVCMINQRLEIKGGQVGNVTLFPPNGCVYVSKANQVASVIYSPIGNTYITSVGQYCKGTTFLSGVGWQVPAQVSSLRNAVATWSGTFIRSDSLR